MFLFTADWHIGAGINRQGSDSIKDSGPILDSLLETVKTMNVKYLVAAGDIFHRPRLRKDEINLFREFIDKMTAEGCRMMYIPGNHEKESQQTGVPLPSAVNPEAFNLTSMSGLWDLEGLKIKGIPEGPPETMREILKDIEPCDLLVMHTAFKHLFSLDQTALVPEDIPSSVGNVLTGHIHKRDKTSGLSSGGSIFSPGPLHATEIKEMGELGGWFTQDPKDAGSWQWIPVVSQELKNCEVKADTECEKVVKEIEEIRKDHSSPIPVTINLHYTPGRRKDLSYIIHSFRECDDVRFTRTVIQETVPEEIEMQDFSETQEFTRDVEAAFAEEVSEEDKEVRDFLYPLLHSNNELAREHIRDWLKEQKVEKISV